MLLEDPLETLWSQASVPDALGVNHQPRATHTDPETPGLGAHRREAGFFEPLFYKLPEFLARLTRTAFRPDAEEEMPNGFPYSGFLNAFFLWIAHTNFSRNGLHPEPNPPPRSSFSSDPPGCGRKPTDAPLKERHAQHPAWRSGKAKIHV